MHYIIYRWSNLKFQVNAKYYSCVPIIFIAHISFGKIVLHNACTGDYLYPENVDYEGKTGLLPPLDCCYSDISDQSKSLHRLVFRDPGMLKKVAANIEEERRETPNQILDFAKKNQLL